MGALELLASAVREAPSLRASYWITLLRVHAATALHAGDEELADRLLIAFASAELARHQASLDGLAQLHMADTPVGPLTLEVDASRTDHALHVLHGALLSGSQELLSACAEWSLDPAIRRPNNIAWFTPTFIDLMLAICYRRTQAAALLTVARMSLPHDLDGARHWCDMAAALAAGHAPRAPDRFYDRAWSAPDTQNYRAFWTLGERALLACHPLPSPPDDGYVARRDALDTDAQARAARLRPLNGFLWATDVSRALGVVLDESALLYPDDAAQQAEGAMAALEMIAGSLSQLRDAERAQLWLSPLSRAVSMLRAAPAGMREPLVMRLIALLSGPEHALFASLLPLIPALCVDAASALVALPDPAPRPALHTLRLELMLQLGRHEALRAAAGDEDWPLVLASLRAEGRHEEIIARLDAMTWLRAEQRDPARHAALLAVGDEPAAYALAIELARRGQLDGMKPGDHAGDPHGMWRAIERAHPSRQRAEILNALAPLIQPSRGWMILLWEQGHADHALELAQRSGLTSGELMELLEFDAAARRALVWVALPRAIEEDRAAPPNMGAAGRAQRAAERALELFADAREDALGRLCSCFAALPAGPLRAALDRWLAQHVPAAPAPPARRSSVDRWEERRDRVEGAPIVRRRRRDDP